MATLYRKYRPQNFQEVVGQNHIKVTLEHEVGSGKLAHAYLFCGPRAVGKTTIARVLAKAINCTARKDGESEPCNKCESCVSITAGKSLDMIEIDAASHTGVDNVRENIIAASRISPSNAKYKVFIIDEVHMLSISAFNALLKILEEPPANVIFMLCTTEVHKIPTTIISRCQRFDFKRISVSDITKKLIYIVNKEKIKVEQKILEAIARHSEGYMRDAESLLGQVVAIGGEEVTAEEADLVIPRSDLKEVLNLIDFLSKQDAGRAIGLVNKILDEGINLHKFVSDTIEILRKMMLTKISPNLADKLGLELGEELEKQITPLAAGLEVREIINMMEKIGAAKKSISGSFIRQLPLEIALVEICIASAPPAIANPAPARPAVAQKFARTETGVSETKTKRTVISGSNLNKEEIIKKWHEVLAKVKQYNHSLSFILRVCEPRNVKGQELCLAFKYKFHRDRIGDINIKRLVEKVLQDVYGQPLNVEAIIDENIEVKEIPNGEPAADKNHSLGAENKADDGKKTNEGMIENLIKNFGGKVVD